MQLGIVMPSRGGSCADVEKRRCKMEKVFAKYLGLTHKELVDRIIKETLADIPDRFTRECPSVNDPEFIDRGVRRVLYKYESGREFIQEIQQEGGHIPRSTYFENLHSDRRKLMLDAAGDSMRAKFRCLFGKAGRNQLAQFPELSGRGVFSADGHYIEHASHSPRDAKGRQVAFGNIYAVDLAYGLTFPIQSILAGRTMHPNEWAVLKRDTKRMMRRMGMSRLGWHANTRPILIYDRAGADATYMEEKALLENNGFDMITRAKENMCVEKLADRPFVKDDIVNTGVLSDCEVKLANGVRLRQVEYKCPESQIKYTFITTERKLRPGVIAWLYFSRWRIEKVFNVFEQKLGENKAWVTDIHSEGVSPCQPEFICMGYNILVFMQAILETEANIKDRMSEEKRRKEIEDRQREVDEHNARLMAKAKKNNSKRKPRGIKAIHPMLLKVVQQCHQMTLQFIRCFRNLLRTQKTLADSFSDYERLLRKCL